MRAEATRHLSHATILGHLNSALLDQRRGEHFLTSVYATSAPPLAASRAACARRATFRP
ncbi:hypothetical protein [Streptomyces sp. NPDC057301]|uniref:hypothetical protein n=1 Tax=Streptomyces sp. NPDC057301 TaxID=3346093 RepID=UPI0036433DB6